ncbi:MAG: class B sortase [Oscillospiraceae bacterium]|nr:class B sortase [Oscillospiraceae bacterium]
MRDDDFHFDPDDEDFWKDEFADSGFEDIDWSREEDYQSRRAARIQRERQEQSAQQSARQSSRQSSHPQRDSQYDRARSSSYDRRQRPSGQPRQQTRRTRSYDQRGQTRAQGSQADRAYDYETQARARSYDNRRRRQKKNIPLIIVAVVLAIGMVIAGWQLISILLNYQRDRSAYNDLAANAISALAETADETVSSTEDTGEETEDDTFVPIIVDWDYLESINTDIVGWLYCPNTVINYPVVQTTDNSYYLTHGFDKETNGAGALFADVSSVAGINMSNLIIYGHHMKDGSMFGDLENYMEQSYYDEHPIMYYLTPTSTYRVDLIAGHIVESTLDNYPGYFDSVEDYQTYLNQITSVSLFSTSATVSTDYQLITLSTCDYSAGYNDPRFLLQGLLVPID